MIAVHELLADFDFQRSKVNLYGSYEYCYLSVDDNGDRSGYANGIFSTTKLGEMSFVSLYGVRVGPSVR